MGYYFSLPLRDPTAFFLEKNTCSFGPTCFDTILRSCTSEKHLLVRNRVLHNLLKKPDYCITWRFFLFVHQMYYRNQGSKISRWHTLLYRKTTPRAKLNSLIYVRTYTRGCEGSENTKRSNDIRNLQDSYRNGKGWELNKDKSKLSKSL